MARQLAGPGTPAAGQRGQHPRDTGVGTFVPNRLLRRRGACGYVSGVASLSDSSSGKQLGGSKLSLARVARRSAADEIREQLVAAIESGQLQVNDRLPSEAELSRAFGVSRPIVREALRSLQALGLTESHTGRGTFVASASTKIPLAFGQYTSSELNEVRRCLEVPAAGQAARRAKPADLAELRQILQEVDQVASPDGAIRLDGQFHCAISRASGNSLFVRLVSDLRELLQEQSHALSMLPGRSERADREHRQILAAIERGDPAAAEKAMLAHLDAVERAVGRLANRRAKSERRSTEA